MLLFVAQASHDLIPPEVIEPILQTLMNNFVTERNSSDVMAIGLNAIREVCTRCPLAMNKELLVDLTGFKTYKDRSVMMAAKSLIHLYRTSMPSLLHKKDRVSVMLHNICPNNYQDYRLSQVEIGIKMSGNTFYCMRKILYETLLLK